MQKMTRTEIKELIPHGLIVGALIYCAIVALSTDVVLTYQHWIAYGLVALAIATYKINRTLSNIIFGIMLILGLFSIAGFTPIIVVFGAGMTIGSNGSEIM